MGVKARTAGSGLPLTMLTLSFSLLEHLVSFCISVVSVAITIFSSSSRFISSSFGSDATFRELICFSLYVYCSLRLLTYKNKRNIKI